MDPQTIANQLSRGQRSCVRNLDGEHCLLGCSEPWAIRLSKGTPRRPALTSIRLDSKGNRLFALNELGMQVKSALGLG